MADGSPLSQLARSGHALSDLLVCARVGNAVALLLAKMRCRLWLTGSPALLSIYGVWRLKEGSPGLSSAGPEWERGGQPVSESGVQLGVVAAFVGGGSYPPADVDVIVKERFG